MTGLLGGMRANKAQMQARLRETETHLHAAYRQTRAALAPTLADLVTRYRAAYERALAAESGRVPVGWASDPHGGRYPQVGALVTAQVRAFGRTAFGLTAAAKGEAVALGTHGATAALEASLRPIAARLPATRLMQRAREQAIRALIERAKDGSPLATLFDGFGPDESAALHDTLIGGLAGGINPRQLGRELAATLDKLTYGRAVTIARTETIHAWNSAALEHYRANSDVVSGWLWVADKSANTCAACLAMDGTRHDLDEDLDDHPNGRCARAPITRSYADILAGFGIDPTGEDFGPSPTDTYQSGADWLAQQDATTQRAVFGGEAAYQAYASGGASLRAYAQVRRDPAWGASIQQTPAKRLRRG